MVQRNSVAVSLHAQMQIVTMYLSVVSPVIPLVIVAQVEQMSARKIKLPYINVPIAVWPHTKVKSSVIQVNHAMNVCAMKTSRMIYSWPVTGMPKIVVKFHVALKRIHRNLCRNAHQFMPRKNLAVPSIGFVVRAFCIIHLEYFALIFSLLFKFSAENLSSIEVIPYQYQIRDSLSCQFGNTKLRKFDELKTNDKCRKCVCQDPPLLTCTHVADCF